MLALYEKYLSGKTGFLAYFVGTKAKDRISNLVFQEALQIFRKMNFSYPLICTRKCAYQGLRNVCFSGNLTCFVFFFFETPVLRFTLLSYYRRFYKVKGTFNCSYPYSQLQVVVQPKTRNILSSLM